MRCSTPLRWLSAVVIASLIVLLIGVRAPVSVRAAEVVPPTCTFTGNFAPPAQGIITVQDAGSGLAEILVTKSQNADTVVPPFIVGTNDSVTVTSTKIDQTKTSEIDVRVTDLDGNVTLCTVVMGFVSNTDDAGDPTDTWTGPTLDLEGTPSSCDATNPFNGTEGAGTRRFDALPVANGRMAPVCVTVALIAQTADTLTSFAVLDAFAGTISSSNYLGDAGSSVALTNYSFMLDGGADGEILVYDVTAGVAGSVPYILGVTLSETAYIIPPDDIVVPNDPGQPGAIVNYPPPPTVGFVGPVTCSPASGSFFRIGTTDVSCRGENGSTASFSVTVEVPGDYDVREATLISQGSSRSFWRVVTSERTLTMQQATEVCRSLGFDKAIGIERYREGGERFTDVICADNGPTRR